MTYRIELHPAILEELIKARQWYEDRSEGLGNRFIAAVEQRLEQIKRNPEQYAKKKRKYREVSIPIFPYKIIYEVLKKEKIVFISYIIHSKRKS